MAVDTPSYGAKDIQVLEGLEPVRKRPGMFIGSTGLNGLHHLPAGQALLSTAGPIPDRAAPDLVVSVSAGRLTIDDQ